MEDHLAVESDLLKTSDKSPVSWKLASSHCVKGKEGEK